MTATFSMYLRFILAVSLVVFCLGFTKASERYNASVMVLRSDNQKPLPDAIVKIVTLKEQDKPAVGFTDAKGVFNYLFTEPVILYISHLGYVTVIDTLYSAQDKTYSIVPAAQNIQDVVVTGQYSPNSVQKSLYEVKVLSSDVLKAKGANNLREALQNELGIDLGQDQVFGSTLGINGISGEGVKILVDGVPIVGRNDGKLDLSQININNIERIEIVEGPLSVLYGTDAMGGVINIITKSFQKEKVNVNLKGYYESAGQYNAELNGGFSFKKNQIYVSGGRNFFDGYSSVDSLKRFQEWKPKEQYFADAKYIFTGNRFRVSLTGAFFRELLLNRGEPRRTLDDTKTGWTYRADDVHFLTYRPRASLSFMYRFKENNQLDVLLAYSGFIRFNNSYSVDLVTLKQTLASDTSQTSLQDTSRYHQIVFRPVYSLPAWKNRISFTLGADVNQEYTVQERISGGNQKAGDYAAFGMVKINVVEGLDIQPAIRFSYNTRFQVPLIPSLNLRYNYKEKITFRTSYGRGYRAPSLKELYLSFVDINHDIRGNEDLKPEDGHSVNASLNYIQPVRKTHSITLAVSGFFNHITNKIDLALVGGTLNSYEYFNLKKYLTYGGDFSLAYNWKSLQLKAAVQATQYELNNSVNSSEKVKAFSPDFIASAGYTIPKALIGIQVFYKYTGNKPLFSITSSVQTGTRFAFHSLDISLSRSFWKERIQLVIGGKNLAGVTNVPTSGVTAIGHSTDVNAANIGWGRTFFTSLVLHFSK